MKNDNNNNNNATTSSNHNQPDNHNTTRTNQPRTNQTTINNLINNYSDLNANGQQIYWLIFDSGETPYSIAKQTGVPDGNLYLVKSGKRSIENLSLSVASKLTEYAIKVQDQQDNNTNDNN